MLRKIFLFVIVYTLSINSYSEESDVLMRMYERLEMIRIQMQQLTEENQQLNNKISNNIDLSISEDKNIIYNAITSDIIFGSSYEDYFYVTISNLEEINESISIDGGSDFDWLVIEAPVKLNSLGNIDIIEISKNNDKALVALIENRKGIEVLDLNFLNVDEGSLKISQHYYNAYYQIIEDPPIDGYDYYWWDVDKKYNFFATGYSLSL